MSVPLRLKTLYITLLSSTVNMIPKCISKGTLFLGWLIIRYHLLGVNVH